MIYKEIFLELIFGYIAIYIVIKVLGKAQITMITPFYLVCSLTIGNILIGGIFNREATVPKILFAIFTWGALSFVTLLITQKSIFARKVFEGDASILIKKGRIQWEELKRNRLDIDQLLQLLRAKKTFSVNEVAYAILEYDGTVSVLKKSNFLNSTKQDLKIKLEEEFLPLIIISDGQIRIRALLDLNKDENWVHNLLSEANLSLIQVCYAEWDSKKLHLHTY